MRLAVAVGLTVVWGLATGLAATARDVIEPRDKIAVLGTGDMGDSFGPR